MTTTTPSLTERDPHGDRLRDIIIAILFLIVGILIGSFLLLPLPQVSTNTISVTLVLVVASLALVFYAYGRRIFLDFFHRRQLASITKVYSTKAISIMRRFQDLVNPDKYHSVSQSLENIRNRIAGGQHIGTIHPYNILIPTRSLEKSLIHPSFNIFKNILETFGFLVTIYYDQYAHSLTQQFEEISNQTPIPNEDKKKYNLIVVTYNNLMDEINSLTHLLNKELEDKGYEGDKILRINSVQKLDVI